MNEQPKRSSSSDVKASVAQQFSQVAANYSTSPVHAGGADLEKMVRVAHLSGQEYILDAGCGPGHTALAFAPFVKKVIALDLSEAMLEQGRRLATARGLDNVEFRQGDVEQLPFADQTFDIVTSRFSAHHWPNPQLAIHEFGRVLNHSTSTNPELLLVDVISSDDFILDTHLQTVELLRDSSHIRDHTMNQWLTMLAVGGFQAEVDSAWDLPIDFQSWVQRMATPPASVQMIENLLDHAPLEVRTQLKVESDHSFSLRCALFRAMGVCA